MDGKSLNIKEDNLKKLTTLFPGIVKDGKVDKNYIENILGFNTIEGNERYELSWAGKTEAYKVLQESTTSTLIPKPQESINWDNTENIFIEGENLEVLKILQKSYYGQIKMIYIDPPYNTGNDSFIYPDKFTETKEEYLKRIGSKDEEGLLMKEGLFRKNNKENGQYHSNWLNMMLPRLFLARNLLKDDGVIFLSIDDNEQANLKLLMDEIFGQENFIGNMIWAGGRKNDSKFISTSHEYILAYAKNFSLLKDKKTIWRIKKKGLDEIYSKYKHLKKLYKEDYSSMTKELKTWYSSLQDSHPSKQHKHYSNVDERGIYFPSDISWPGGGGPKYKIIHPITKKQVVIPSRGWLFAEQSKMEEKIKENRVHFGEDENSVPCMKSYLEEREFQVPYSVFYQDGRSSTKRLRTLMGGDYFEHPKDENVLYSLMEFCTKDNDIILDFFAGSGTSAQAVMEINKTDGGNRKFICVQLPEVTDVKSEANKAGYKTISSITEARIKKVIENIKVDTNNKTKSTNLQLGFRKFSLSNSNFKIWRGDIVDNEEELKKQLSIFVKPQKDNTMSYNILWELLIKNGLPLSENIKMVELSEGEIIYFTKENSFAFVLDVFTKNVLKEIVKLKPKFVIILDSLFNHDDKMKTNTQLKFEDNNIVFKTI